MQFYRSVFKSWQPATVFSLDKTAILALSSLAKSPSSGECNLPWFPVQNNMLDF